MASVVSFLCFNSFGGSGCFGGFVPVVSFRCLVHVVHALFVESTPFLTFWGYYLLQSFPVGGSFSLQFGDHFRSRDHLQAGIICGPVQPLVIP